MPRPFGTTPHSEIAHAFEAENRQHTFVEEIQVPSGGSGGTVTEYIKKYELRITLEELIPLLDTLAGRHPDSFLKPFFVSLASRQLRAKILATLGLFEEG